MTIEKQSAIILQEQEKQNAIILLEQEKQKAIILQEVEKKKATILILDRLKQKSRIRMSKGVIFANIKPHAIDDGYYEKLVPANYTDDMTNWAIDNSTDSYDLLWLAFYPVILADSNRMGFMRVAKGQITYVRTKVKREYLLGKLNLDVIITFPKTDTYNRNIIIEINHPIYGSCEFDILFNGCLASIVDKRYIKLDDISQSQAIDFLEYLDIKFSVSKRHLDNLLKYLLSGFKYKVLGIEDKNIRELLDGFGYQLSIIGSSAKFMGDLWFGEFPKCMI